jgi:ubiquinone/menaquinone biosynthesis C-methylase UbiE
MNPNDTKGKVAKGYKSVAKSYDIFMSGADMRGRIILKIMGRFNVNAYREKLLTLIANDFSGKLLDIPCGTGALTYKKYEQMTNAEIICMDYSNEMLEVAKSRYTNDNIKIMQGDVGNIPFTDKTFDVVLSMNGFHVFPDKEIAFNEINRVLKDNGTFVGCFYIKERVKRADWFIKHFFEPNGIFTAPFYTYEELKRKLESQYIIKEYWTVGPTICFQCKKANNK